MDACNRGCDGVTRKLVGSVGNVDEEGNGKH